MGSVLGDLAKVLVGDNAQSGKASDSAKPKLADLLKSGETNVSGLLDKSESQLRRPCDIKLKNKLSKDKSVQTAVTESFMIAYSIT